MALNYHIPAGQTPDENLAFAYIQQPDGSYLLDVDNLPAARETAALRADAPAEPIPAEPMPAEPMPAEGATPEAPIIKEGKGTGAPIASLSPSHLHLIAPHDGQAIAQSIEALATGAATLLHTHN